MPDSTLPPSDVGHAGTSLPVRVYSPEPAIQHPTILLSALWRDVLAGRELAWRLFIRDLSASYRQTYLGYVWAVLPPLVTSLTFIFLQSQGITKIEGTGIPFAAFAMMGTLIWQTFVDAMGSPLAAVNSAKPMLAKINFPREAILMAGMYMVVFNLLIRVVLMAGVMAVWGIVPGVSVVLFPLAILGLLLFGFALGMLLVPVGTLYGDVGRGINVIAQFWMLLTPVVYPARTTGFAGWLATWNPVSPLVVTARATLTAQPLDFLPAASVVTVCSAVVALLGLICFRLIIPHLIARMGG